MLLWACRKVLYLTTVCGRGRHPWEDHTYQGDVHVPPGGECPMWTVMGMWKKGVITVDGEPVCPAPLHPTCVTVGTCQGSSHRKCFMALL